MTGSSTQPARAARFLVTAAALVVVAAGLRAASVIVVPFLLALFITIVTAPAVFWLKRRRVPEGLAILLVVMLIAAVGLLLGKIVGRSLDGFSESLPLYQQRLEGALAALTAWLAGFGIELPERGLREAFNPGSAMRFANTVLGGLGSVLSNAALILIAVIFMLAEASSFPQKLRAVLRDPAGIQPRVDRFVDSVKRYMAIKTLTSLATGVLIATWLWLLGVEYPLLWGLLAFLLNYVPNIGSVLAAVPPLLLAWVQQGSTTALLVGLGFVAVNVSIGSFLEPKVMGRGVGLSTLVVFASLVFWGWLLGPIGMVLSVPLTITVKLGLEAHPDTHWLAVLLGGAPGLPQPAARLASPDA